MVEEKNIVIPKKAVIEKFTVENKFLIDSLLFMKQNKLMREISKTPNFESVREAEDFFKEEVTSAVKEKINDIKEGISDLQKKGYELHLESINLLKIPLKLKVWESNFLKKDLGSIYDIFNAIDPLIKKLLIEMEEREKLKEKKETLKEKEELKKSKEKESKPHISDILANIVSKEKPQQKPTLPLNPKKV